MVPVSVERSSGLVAETHRRDWGAGVANAEPVRGHPHVSSGIPRHLTADDPAEVRWPMDPVRPSSRGPPPASHAPGRQDVGSDEQDPRVEMQIMSQPERASRPAVLLYPPLAVRLRLREPCADDRHALRDFSQVWAFVSLADADGVETLAPPREGLLTGRLTDSAHPLSRPRPTVSGRGAPSEPGSSATEDAPDSFVMFPDLTIREPGQYRLRVTLFNMQTPAGPTQAGPYGASSLQEVTTDVIEIRDPPGADRPAGKSPCLLAPSSSSSSPPSDRLTVLFSMAKRLLGSVTSTGRRGSTAALVVSGPMDLTCMPPHCSSSQPSRWIAPGARALHRRAERPMQSEADLVQ